MASNKQAHFVLIIIMGGLVFYGLPLIFHTTVLTMGLMYIINPIYSFVAGMIYSTKYGMIPYLPLALGVLFIPASLLFFQPWAVVLGGFYCAISFAGSIVGHTVFKKYH